MHIYITDDNKSKLQEYRDTGKSMSGLVNRLLDTYWRDGEAVEIRSKAEPHPDPRIREMQKAGLNVILPEQAKDDREEWEEIKEYQLLLIRHGKGKVAQHPESDEEMFWDDTKKAWEENYTNVIKGVQ